METQAPKIPLTIVHHGRFDPRVTTGGVETFARNLGLIFEEVLFTTPKTSRKERKAIMERRLPVICDNQMVVDWPSDYPVVGFQHGCAHVKARMTGNATDRKLAKGQAKAAKRPNTVWVACARWISKAFEALHGNKADHVLYHFVDVERFDGRLENAGTNLVLHDGRSEHKGSKLFPILQERLPQWRFETLNCKPHEVPDRMRTGAAFLHLSRYEGNSIVCNEAMAMNLPCFFTEVGLMKDGEDLDVHVVPMDAVYGDSDRMVSEVAGFLDSLSTRTYQPRNWSLQNATQAANVAGWRKAMAILSERSGWQLELG